MVHNLLLCSFILLLVLFFPQAQSVRLKFSHFHLRGHSHHHGTIKHLRASSSEDTIKAPKAHIQMVTTLPDEHQHVGDLSSMLETPVSGPNPGGNSGPNPGGNSATVAAILDIPVSGPNPGGNSQILTAKSNPNPVEILAASSGPNPGGNSQILAVSSGPNPGGNSQILAASSSPNPGGNSQILAASSSPNPGGNSEILSANSGPNLGGNSDILAARASLNHGGNAVQLGDMLVSFRSNLSHRAVNSVLMSDSVFSKLPRAPVPPSGPSPGHNSDMAQEGLFAARKLIGCDGDQGIRVALSEEATGRFPHLGSLINSVSSMGVASQS